MSRSHSHRHALRFSPFLLPPRSSLAVSSLSFWIVTATPTVRESQSLYPTTTTARIITTAKVSFWNYSGRDVKLRVDGETRTLAAGRGLTLEMPREFIGPLAV